MTLKTRLAVAAIVSGMASGAHALELGEFQGTSFSLGGYIKAEGRWSNPDAGGTSFDSTTRQSRINMTTRREVEGHKVMTFIEGDFYGANASGSSYDWRLRHAFIKVDNLTIGQTWNGQFLATVPYDVPHLDFFNAGKGGPAGNGGVVRPDLVAHYQMDKVRLTLQDPINPDADYPDFVVNYAQKFTGGHALSLAVSGRDVDTSTAANPDSSKLGASFLFAGKYALGATTLHLTGYTGKGQAVYSGFGYGGAYPAGGDVDAQGDLVSTTGFSVGASHRFSDKLKGAVRYGQIKADETSAGTEDQLEIAHVNMVYTYLPGLDVGVEWRDQNVTTHPTRLAGQQVELMGMYRF